MSIEWSTEYLPITVHGEFKAKVCSCGAVVPAVSVHVLAHEDFHDRLNEMVTRLKLALLGIDTATEESDIATDLRCTATNCSKGYFPHPRQAGCPSARPRPDNLAALEEWERDLYESAHEEEHYDFPVKVCLTHRSAEPGWAQHDWYKQKAVSSGQWYVCKTI